MMVGGEEFINGCSFIVYLVKVIVSGLEVMGNILVNVVEGLVNGSGGLDVLGNVLYGSEMIF